MHVVDISHPYFQDQMETVNQTLQDIGAGEKPTILVFNKIDQFKEFDQQLLEEMENPSPTLEDLKRPISVREIMRLFLSLPQRRRT